MEFIIEKTPDIEKELLLQDIRQSARKVAKITLSVKEYAKNGNFDPIKPILYFGSWKAALEQAGLRTSPHNFVPSSALMENIRSVWVKLGRQPKKSEMIKPLSKYSSQLYYRRFGSWANMIDI